MAERAMSLACLERVTRRRPDRQCGARTFPPITSVLPEVKAAMTITINRRWILLLALCALVAACGAAIAAWSTSGSGNGYAKATTASAITLADASASTSGDLYPGGAGDLKIKISNPNTFPVRITAVAGNGTITSDTGGCTSVNHAATLTDQTGLSIDLVYQFFVHTEKVGKLPRWFEYVFNTPSHHRVHHGSDAEYLDANYAGILIIWDRMFGSFVPEGRRPTYGLTKNIETHNLLKVGFHEYGSILRDLRGARSWRERAGYVFGPPGWQPADQDLDQLHEGELPPPQRVYLSRKRQSA